MAYSISVDLSGVNLALDGLSSDVKNKALPTAYARIALSGEKFIKIESPYLTGALRRGLHAHPRTKPTSIYHSTNYTWAANVRSRRPGFIEKTVAYMENIAEKETKTAVEAVVKRF